MQYSPLYVYQSIAPVICLTAPNTFMQQTKRTL